MKACINQTIDTYCTEPGWFQKLIKLYLGPYNPFCVNEVDPTHLLPSTKPTASAGKTASYLYTDVPKTGFFKFGVNATTSMMPVDSTTKGPAGSREWNKNAKARSTGNYFGKSWWKVVPVVVAQFMLRLINDII